MFESKPMRPTTALKLGLWLLGQVRAVAALSLALPLALPLVVGSITNVHAAYDIDTLGVPKFVNTVYIDLAKITRISKFRSYVGHDYSDQRQFGNDGVKDSRNRAEVCRSMKHYFIAPDASFNIYSPVTGKVANVTDEFLGQQIEIQSDAYPDFRFIIFHVALSPRLAIGDQVTEGQRLGTHGGSETWSDMAVWVQTPKGKHLISYFETLTDDAFAVFKARGMTSPSDAIIPKAQRDAEPIQCPGFSGSVASEFFNFTGGAVTQTITSQALTKLSFNNVDDPAIALKPVATSGLPVTITPLTPKVCSLTGDLVTFRRTGVCKITLTQAGDANTFAAPSVSLNTFIMPKGVTVLERLRLGGIFPPSSSGPQSYIRIFNEYSPAGTVSLSLFDGATGQTVATWTSPPIATGASVQYGIAEIESAAAAGFKRPAAYGLRVESDTKIFGYLQHVVFDPAAGALLNYSTCGTGVTAPRDRVMNAHTSRLSDGYPSSIRVSNYGSSAQGMQPRIVDAATGTLLGFYLGTAIPPNAVQQIDIDSIESSVTPPGSSTKIKITPGPSTYHYNFSDDGILNNFRGQGYYQHLVTSKKSGVISDMTTACVLYGQLPSTTVPLLLRSASLFSGSQTTAQSFLRFYNSGSTTGPVSVTLYDAKTGQAFGPWVSPNIPAGSQQQYSVAAIESALALAGRDSYGLSVQTDIDGSFQHVVWRAPDGAISNLSRCAESVTVDPKTLIGVHSSTMSRAGYPSTIMVNNTADAAASVKLTIVDANDGKALGTYTTRSIPANGQLTLDVATLEAGAQIAPGAALLHYIVKAEESFSGFLQHLVNNQSAGVVTDLSAVCMM